MLYASSFFSCCNLDKLPSFLIVIISNFFFKDSLHVKKMVHTAFMQPFYLISVFPREGEFFHITKHDTYPMCMHISIVEIYFKLLYIPLHTYFFQLVKNAFSKGESYLKNIIILTQFQFALR